MSKLRLSVIGAGSWAVSSHLPELAKRRDEVEFHGVCRLGGDLLAQIRDKWGFAHASEDYREVLARGADIVLVGSPAALHHEHARAALEAGAHVLVEKPFTTTSAQAWDLVETARRVGRHLLVAYGYNYRPMMRQAREHIARHGGIGQVESMMVYMASGVRELLSGAGAYARASSLSAPDLATWVDPALSGGGYGQAQLTHALGLALWLHEVEVTEVNAVVARPLGGTVEQHDAAVLHLAGGGIGTLTGASAHQKAMEFRDQLQVRMVGAEGQFQLDVENDRLRMFRDGTGDVDLTFPAGSGRYECDGPPHTLVDLGLGRDVENCSPGELGARTVAVLEAMYASAREGRPVPVGRPATAD
ncbi:Gfo/Idh/MocA family protein [Phytohabitans kaempferiae]|uniref:Gfo/Idh/MocA family protein n=1 Tax=Phytohabitans kaempferiae TaxID=1620943 RepID=A0ABV6M3R6_9ACTN